MHVKPQPLILLLVVRTSLETVDLSRCALWSFFANFVPWFIILKYLILKDWLKAELRFVFFLVLYIHIFIPCSPFGLLITAVMRSDGFEYLKENCPSLQSELLKTIAGCDEDCSSGGAKSRSVWAQLSDGGDNGRRVRQRTWYLIVVL